MKVKAGVKDGLSEVSPLGQKELRGVVKAGQKPVKTKGSVKSDRGSFKLA